MESTCKEERMVTSVSSFLAQIEEIRKKFKEQNKSLCYFYRGQGSNRHSKILPSLYRNKGLVRNEWHIYHEAIYKSLIDFSDCRTTLEELTKMRHYEIPTRVLDVTTNPLVGLFFACYSYQKGNTKNSNPMVYLFIEDVDEVKGFDSDNILVLSNLAKLDKPRYSWDFMDKYPCLHFRNFAKKYNNSELLSKIRMERPSFSSNINNSTLSEVKFVYAKRNNSRILKQSGVLIMFGVDPHKEFECPSLEDYLNKKNKGKINQRIFTFKISCNCILSIIEELESINISELSLEVGDTSLGDYFKSKYEDK